MTKAVLPLLFALSLNLYNLNPSYANESNSARVYFATGEVSQTDAIEDRDLSGDYSFYRYGGSVQTKAVEKLYCRAGYERYDKDFDTARNGLDNKTDIYKAYLSYPVHKKDDTSLKLSADYRLRAKRYENSPLLEYDQNNISAGADIEIENNYSLKLSGGLKDYEYINNSSSDTLKTFIKIAPGIKNDRVSVSGYYRRDWIDQSAGRKDYSEDTVSARTSLEFDTAFVKRLSGHFECGKNDTRDSEEDREDNQRFTYRLWDVKSQHELSEELDTQFTYGQKYRQYITSINSYENWFMENKTNLNIFKKDSFKIDFILAGEHKETKFYINENLSYNKNSISGGLNILERSNFSVKPSFQFTKYVYPPGSTSNQEAYKLNLDTKKYLGSTDTAIEAGFWYKWKDYEYKNDVEQWSLNIAYEIRF